MMRRTKLFNVVIIRVLWVGDHQQQEEEETIRTDTLYLLYTRAADMLYADGVCFCFDSFVLGWRDRINRSTESNSSVSSFSSCNECDPSIGRAPYHSEMNPFCLECLPQFEGDQCQQCATGSHFVWPYCQGGSNSICSSQYRPIGLCDECSNPRYDLPYCDGSTCAFPFTGMNCTNCLDGWTPEGECYQFLSSDYESSLSFTHASRSMPNINAESSRRPSTQTNGAKLNSTGNLMFNYSHIAIENLPYKRSSSIFLTRNRHSAQPLSNITCLNIQMNVNRSFSIHHSTSTKTFNISTYCPVNITTVLQQRQEFQALTKRVIMVNLSLIADTVELNDTAIATSGEPTMNMTDIDTSAYTSAPLLTLSFGSDLCILPCPLPMGFTLGNCSFHPFQSLVCQLGLMENYSFYDLDEDGTIICQNGELSPLPVIFHTKKRGQAKFGCSAKRIMNYLDSVFSRISPQYGSGMSIHSCGSYLSHGSSCNVSCLDGYQFDGTSQINCNNGTISINQPMPSCQRQAHSTTASFNLY